jgi:hypothetical protein
MLENLRRCENITTIAVYAEGESNAPEKPCDGSLRSLCNLLDVDQESMLTKILEQPSTRPGPIDTI